MAEAKTGAYDLAESVFNWTTDKMIWVARKFKGGVQWLVKQ